MVNTLEFLTHELSTTIDEILQRCRNRDIVRKRWTIICFYKLKGFSTVKIGNVLNLNHQTVLHGIKHSDEEIRSKAKELYYKFTHEKPNDDLLPKEVKTIKIPDYKNSKIVTKEIEV